MDSDRATGRIGAGFVFGLVLIASGISSLLERAHVFETITIGQWWPLVLVAIGLAKLKGPSEDRRGGWIFLGLGGWGLAIVFTSLTFSDTWPMVLLVWGASMIWSGLMDQEPTAPELAGPSFQLGRERQENSHVS